MSNQVNDELMDRAWDAIEYFTDTTTGGILLENLEAQDYEALQANLVKAEAVMAQQEFYDNDLL